jgi:hypothetical protein
MFIKLSFTSDTRMTVPLRIITDIINTPSVTSVSALQSRFTSASYDTTLTSNFDAANSNIIRTSSPSNTIAHYTTNGNAAATSYGNFEFTIEHSVYDNTSTKFYTQLTSNSVGVGVSTYYYAIGDSITGGTISSVGLPISYSDTATSTTASAIVNQIKLTLGGTPLSFTNAIAGPTTSGGNNIRTFWAYITDKCFIWATTNATSFNSGFGSTYTDPTKFCGPFIVSQYTRFDYHNTNSNGVIPVMYSSPRGTGIGWGTASDLTSTWNPLYASDSTSLPMRVYNLISAAPQVGSAWPKIYNPYIQPTIAGRGNETVSYTYGAVAGAAGSAGGTSYGSPLTIVASARFVNSTLTSNTFGLLPLGWQHTYYGNYGGNASDQAGFYMFNGDYVPGDTFILNSIAYMIWPMYSGYTNRIGLAVPMV